MATNRALAETLREELLVRGCVTIDTPRKNKGSLDAGNVSRRAPLVHAYLPAAPSSLAIHTREFGEAATGPACADALRAASGAMAATVLRLARDGELRARVRQEFETAGLAPRPGRWPLLTSEPASRVEC